MSFAIEHQIANGKLTPESLTPVPPFNWVFLVELIVSGILTLFFLFYFNRLFATLVSYGIRAYTWHYYRAYVNIHALQISLLAGRVFFKGIRYHGENETILIQTGHVTWRFWSRPVAPVDTFHHERQAAPPTSPQTETETLSGKKHNHSGTKEQSPSRIEVTLNGLEWFVYNRSPAYDSILAGFGFVPPPPDRTDSSIGQNDGKAQRSSLYSEDEDRKHGDASSILSIPLSPSSEAASNTRNRREAKDNRRSSVTGDSFLAHDANQEAGPRFLALFPIAMECHRGALALGNENTKTILSLTFDKAMGKIDAGCSGPLDVYKQIIEFDLSHPIIQMKPNPDYKQPQLAATSGLEATADSSKNHDYFHGFHRQYRHHKRRIWNGVRDLIPYFQNSVESFHPRRDPRARPTSGVAHGDGWVGLTRYLDEEGQGDHEGWSSIEYGRFSTILDSPSVSFRYHWDVGGPVTISKASPSPSSKSTFHNVNGAEPPEWGMDITIRGGLLNYGPWADRERINLQSVFIPNSYRDACVASPLKPGQTRQSIAFTLSIFIVEVTTLRIPTREPSKDWQWKGRADQSRLTSRRRKKKDKDHSRGNEAEKGGSQRPDIRPFGWLSLRVSPGSTIVYSMAMFASSHGYRNEVKIDLRETKMSSSVNHGILWQSDRQLISCDLSNPLQWNSTHDWSVDAESSKLELFLLWDHLILLTDLISDWTSGPFQEYYTFVPIKYHLSFSFPDFKLLANVNDLNIINNPSDLEENSFLIIEGEIITARVEIPIVHHKAKHNIATFDIEGSNGDMRLSTPLWNTQHTFLDDRPVGALDTLKIHGSYAWYNLTSPKVTDVVIVNLSGSAPRLYLYGFILKNFLDVNENYFGRTIHFKTLDEHRAAVEAGTANEISGSNPAPHTNGLDVILHIVADDIEVLLPTGLYDRNESLALNAASLDLDVRFTNYYMDFHASLSPLEVSKISDKLGIPVTKSGPQLYINGLDIFGHRLFGLPPTEPTYACNWDFQVGSIVGECSSSFIKSAKSAIDSLAFSFDDDENALPPIQTGVYDVTFLRANVKSVKVWILVDSAAFLFSTGYIDVGFNDRCGLRTSLFVDITVPDIVIATVDRASITSQTESHKSVKTYACFETSLKVKTLGRREAFEHYRSLQQNHIRKHDLRTHRTPWLVYDQFSSPTEDEINPRFIPPTMPIPSMPEPIHSISSHDHRSYLQASRQSPSNNALNSSNIPLTASLNPSPDQYSHHERTARINSTTWAMPKFSLYKVDPDKTNIPLIPSGFEYFPHEDQMLGPISQTDDDKADVDGSQTTIVCKLGSGLTGFFSPEALHALSALLEDIQPRHPVEILDSFQAKLTSTALREQKRANKETHQTSVFSFSLPLCRIRFLGPSSTPEFSSETVTDQYHLDLFHIRAVVREKALFNTDSSTKPAKTSIARLTVGSISISVRDDDINAPRDRSLCNLRISDIAFCLLDDTNLRTRLQIQDIKVVSSSESVLKLTLMAHRASKMADTISRMFEQTSKAHEDRLLYLVYELANCGAQMPEPLFMTRLSYALRVTKPHLRMNDAWKIMSRLRNIYKTITPEMQKQLQEGCQSKEIYHPVDAEAHILSIFETWRTWELTPIKKSIIVKALWGENNSDDATASRPQEVTAMLSLRSFQILLDPGPRQNSFIIEDILSMALYKARYQHVSTDVLVIDNHCSNISLQLNWELCETFKRAIKDSPFFARKSTSPPNTSLQQTKSTLKSKCEVQVVFITDRGLVTLDGINLKLGLQAESMKASILHRPGAKLAEDLTNVILATRSSSARLTSHLKPLMEWKFQKPSLFLSLHSEDRTSHFQHNWKCAATCETLRYDVTENPLGLIHVAESVVEDEVKYILNLADSVPSMSSENGMPQAAKKVVHYFHVTTFLEDYQIRLSLLPTVEYTIKGYVARLSVIPLGRMKFELDYDIKDNFHKIQSIKDGNSRILSSMAIPPINGRVRLDMAQDAISIDIDTTIEAVHVDASDVQTILSAINGPEITHFVEDLSHDGGILKSRMDEVLSNTSTKQPKPKSAKEHDITYQVRFTFAGIKTHASSPGLRTKDHSADMSLDLGTIQIHAGNSVINGSRSTRPEFHIYLSQIGASIKKKGKQETVTHGKLAFGARVSGSLKELPDGQVMRLLHLTSSGLEVEVSAETASLVVDIVAHLQETIKTIDISQEVAHLRKLRMISFPRRKYKEITQKSKLVTEDNSHLDALAFLDATYSVELSNIQFSWLVSEISPDHHGSGLEDLVFSISKVELTTKKTNAARLRIQNMQLQMVPISDNKKKRSQNSALLPEAVFNVSFRSIQSKWNFAFQAAGKALDIRFTSDFIIPASLLQRSLASAVERVREAKSLWSTEFLENPNVGKDTLEFKQLDSLLIDADFAGAIVTLQGRHGSGIYTPISRSNRSSMGSNDPTYGQAWYGDSVSTATLRAPGVALKVRFAGSKGDTPILEAEMKVDGSSNVLHPNVVPLLSQISSTIQDVVGGQEKKGQQVAKEQVHKTSQDISIDPTTILGRCKLSIGLWIRKQEFTLSCQPIARVAATAGFEDINITVNTVQSEEHRRFFAVLMAFNKLRASVKHVYSNESTASLSVDSIVVSMMNSKHVSSSSGISAILKISPANLQMNAKQAQDFLLFREIWTPPDTQSKRPTLIPEELEEPEEPSETQAYMVQRYQQMAAAGAFPWNATLAIDSLDIQLDLGQTIGKSDFTIKNLWVSSKKTSDWEQNLCIGFETVGVKSRGRLSGFVELSKFKVRTSIKWPKGANSASHTPLIQAAVGIGKLQGKISFEYQPFLVMDVEAFEFFMYNVRDEAGERKDRLVSVLEGDKLHVFCTTMTASQGLGLYQTLQRLVQEKHAAYQASLREVENALHRKILSLGALPQRTGPKPGVSSDKSDTNLPISLQTSVVVTLRAIKFGAFPNSFHDSQIFKLEALDAEARFSVVIEEGKIRNGLGLTLGQLRVALSSVGSSGPSAGSDLSVDEIVSRATGSRGGTILKVPRVVATMETWQTPTSNHIEYIFKSSFEGKVDVGWNYSRIAFIRGMWSTHSRALASRLGKPLPQAAVQITGGPKAGGKEGEFGEQEKITAVVNVPQSRYTYTPMEPAVIETPQLRDMGEATPPLEWIGLQRDRLPNITHQIIIVTLMEIAKDVEDAYSKILGSS